MGILSKVWKGFKKGVKKIAKGVKKVFKKIGKAVGKLGIVGQIGMMFLMPYAMGAIGSFFGTAGKLASWSNTLLGSSNVLAQGVGHGLNLINKAGTFVGNAYKSVTGTISEAFDRTGNFLKGRGFVKTPVVDPTTSIIPKDPSEIARATETGVSLDTEKILGLEEKTTNLLSPDTVSDIAKGVDPLSKSVTTVKDSKNFFDMSADDFAKSMKTDPSIIAETVKGVTDPTSLLGPKEQTFLEQINIFDKDSQIRKDIAGFDAYDYGKEAVKGTATEAVLGGAKMAGKQAIAKGLGYEPPEGADYFSIDLPGMSSAGTVNRNVYDQYDLTATRMGNPYIVQNVSNSNYLNNLIANDNDSYKAYMANFAASTYTPMQRSLGGF